MKQQKPKTEKATFAGGCFWHVEHAFRKLKGVVSVTSGYTGGKTKNPTYQQVCSGNTGHVEAILVEYNPSKIKYGTLLNLFWKSHNPERHDGQGADIGSQYRATIFYHNSQQKKAALDSKAKLEKSGKYRKIATRILSTKTFYKAEEYHQRYFEKHKFAKFICRV